ncbi:MAG: hypothetical protein ACD_75C00608G0006 [uncultured bacterium]|nr:MAG: hypothetical protein ACD_75C00608G0006 [uncultured bacterium]
MMKFLVQPRRRSGHRNIEFTPCDLVSLLHRHNFFAANAFHRRKGPFVRLQRGKLLQFGKSGTREIFVNNPAVRFENLNPSFQPVVCQEIFMGIAENLSAFGCSEITFHHLHVVLEIFLQFNRQLSVQKQEVEEHKSEERDKEHCQVPEGDAHPYAAKNICHFQESPTS